MLWSSSDDVEVLTFLPADQLTFWDLTAKFTVSTKDSTESGSIRWMLNSIEERLDILAPTGSVVAQVTVSDSEARLKTDDQNCWSECGYIVPRSHGYFLSGGALVLDKRTDAPDLSVESVEKDGDGRITELTQDGWRLLQR